MPVIQITDGRSALWQWDTGVKIRILGCCSVQQCHFPTAAGLIARDAVNHVCAVPDAALQTAGTLKVYAYSRNDDGGITMNEFSLPVTARPKPADYIDPPDEYDNLDALAQRVAEKIGSIGGGIVVETDPTVPSWAKQPDPPAAPVQSVNGKTGDVQINASDVGALPEDTEIPKPYILPIASADTLGGVKVGNGLQIDTAGSLSVKPDGVYELIETITLDEDMVIERTQEPDGTPYNFTRLAIKGVTTAANAQGGNCETRCKDRVIGLFYIGGFSNNTGSRYMLYECMQDGAGYWKTDAVSWNTNQYSATYLSSYYSHRLTRPVKSYPDINSLKTPILPAGTKIEIWGVRANA